MNIIGRENKNILFNKVLEDAARDNSTIIKRPRKIDSSNSNEMFCLIINWKKKKLYSYDKLFTSPDSGEPIANLEQAFSFFELTGFGISVVSSGSINFKEYFSQFNIKKDGGIPRYLTGIYYSNSFSKIESKNVTEIKFFLSYKELSSRYTQYKYISMYNDNFDIIEKEKIIKQSKIVEEKLKRVISITDKNIYSNIIDKRLPFLESDISLNKKLECLYDLFISNEIDLSKFIQKKKNLLSTYTIPTSKNV